MAAILDRRGKRKSEEEMSEFGKLRENNKLLEAEKKATDGDRFHKKLSFQFNPIFKLISSSNACCIFYNGAFCICESLNF